MSSGSSAGASMRTCIGIAPGIIEGTPRRSSGRTSKRSWVGRLGVGAVAKRPDASRRSASVRRPPPRHRGFVRNLVDIATRRAGGIEVALIWNRQEKTLVVFAYDPETSEEIAIPVTQEEAADVYRHPFAYAHRSRRPAR